MSARIAPEPIVSIAPVFAEYRPAAVGAEIRRVDAVSPSGDATRSQVGSSVAAEVPAGQIVEESAPAPVAPPVAPPAEPSGASYVRAVISGALSPRPTSAQELFVRVGTGWVPPESEYRLADKTI